MVKETAMYDALLGIIAGLALLTMGIMGSRRATKQQSEMAAFDGHEDADGDSDGGGGDGGD